MDVWQAMSLNWYFCDICSGLFSSKYANIYYNDSEYFFLSAMNTHDKGISSDFLKDFTNSSLYKECSMTYDSRYSNSASINDSVQSVLVNGNDGCTVQHRGYNSNHFHTNLNRLNLNIHVLQYSVLHIC